MNAGVEFVPRWRREQSAAFRLHENSTAKGTITFPLWGERVTAYANANLSIVSPQECNAKCPFCVEKLRPASRGGRFIRLSPMGAGKRLWALESALDALKPLNPSVSITGGEPSLDPSLPDLLALLRGKGARKMTMTTNGSGLFMSHEGRTNLDLIIESGMKKLNISRVSPDEGRNAELMRMTDGLDNDALRKAVRIALARGVRPRLSCALVQGEVDNLEKIIEYLDFARRLGADNVIFRELMRPDLATMDASDPVARYCWEKRVPLPPILERVGPEKGFKFIRQVMGYYYYVEVWRYKGIDAAFESADLARLEAVKVAGPGVIHELVFHPSGRLCSTWQEWDGRLSPHWDLITDLSETPK